MNRIRTGDLYLGNRWSIQSLLAKTANPTTSWSEVGIFVIDDSDPQEVETYVYLADQSVEKVKLAELLAEPNLQAAAHRSNSRTKIRNAALIKEYLLGAEGKPALYVQKALQLAFPQHADITPNLGERIDEFGKTVNEKTLMRRGFTNVDLVMAALAAGEILTYRPDAELAHFQNGGGLDDFFEPETALMPTAKFSREAVLAVAASEVQEFINFYIDQLPQTTPKNVKFLAAQRINHGPKKFLAKASRGDGPIEIEEVGPTYIEQQSGQLQPTNRGLANKRAEQDLSISIDRRMRAKEEALAKYPRPQPGFRKK